jgi:hypothetical protein
MFPIPASRPQTGAAATSASRPGQASGSRFALPEGGNATAKSVATVGAPMSLDGLVALQAQEDGTERRRRHLRRGHDLLGGLDRLKAALLAGRVPLADLARLQGELAQRREASDDPGLEDVLAHIELRVAVELAKLGR